MLVVGKPAEFGPNDFPIRGQCQPHTRNWRLRLVSRGKEELLHVNTYYICRELQDSCGNLSREEIQVKINEVVERMGNNMEETQRLPVGEAASPQDAEATAAFQGQNYFDSANPVREADHPASEETPNSTPRRTSADADTQVFRRSSDTDQVMRKKNFE